MIPLTFSIDLWMQCFLIHVFFCVSEYINDYYTFWEGNIVFFCSLKCFLFLPRFFSLFTLLFALLSILNVINTLHISGSLRLSLYLWVSQLKIDWKLCGHRQAYWVMFTIMQWNNIPNLSLRDSLRLIDTFSGAIQLFQKVILCSPVWGAEGRFVPVYILEAGVGEGRTGSWGKKSWRTYQCTSDLFYFTCIRLRSSSAVLLHRYIA